MKELFPPTPPAIVREDLAGVRALFDRNVLPTYGRFELALSHGSGSWLWAVQGRKYLDFGGGIAVCALGHANPEITAALIDQSRRLVHVSNLYYHSPQGLLAEQLVSLIGPGKCFFANSGAEANEGLYKLARKFGHEEGRFEIITALNSFHGRTLAGISATGQEKVKKGFEPMVSGFRHVPFNDLAALRAAISPATSAILIEPIQGEIGVTPATRDYLLGLRALCDERNLLLLLDEVQSGHFRTGQFQAWQTLLGDRASGFLPDGVSMAKSLGGGFPMGAFWVNDKHAHHFTPGTHGSTFGGTPLGCTVALKILEVIRRDKLDQNARQVGAYLLQALQQIQAKTPSLVHAVRGFGLMIALELAPRAQDLAGPGKTAAAHFVNLLNQEGLLTVPAGPQIVRILPALNLSMDEAAAGIAILERVLGQLA